MHSWMQTYTGKAFYPMDADVRDVDPLDIAHALGLLCRYGGHVRRFYSVAEHCVLMSRAVPEEYAPWALLHDATEAYMGDMIRPLKDFMPEYRLAEDRLMKVICDRFGVIVHDMPPLVRQADARIILDEREALMSAPPASWTSVDHLEPLGVQIQGWSPGHAERQYMRRLRELFPNYVPPVDMQAGHPIKLWAPRG